MQELRRAARIKGIGTLESARWIVRAPTEGSTKSGIETAGLLSLISRAEQEITLIHEYRTRLIADVVTGKLDVREVAAGLPREELAVDASTEPYDPDGSEGAPEDESFNSEEE